MSRDKAIIDLDFIKYKVACIGQVNTIMVRHPTGLVKEFNTRTEFYGHYIKKDKGWLSRYNEDSGKELLADEFEIEDKVERIPIENVFKAADITFKRALSQLGTSNYKAFLGEGDSFRVELSTLMKYKGNRDGVVKPLAMEEVVEYLHKKYKPEVVSGIEADDAVVMECYKQPSNVIVGVDKDYYGQPSRFMNFDRPEEGVYNCNCFGKLWKDGKKWRGYGRQFLYFQIISQDTVDNYKASKFSDIKWGEASAHKALVGCKNDKEALQVVKEVYQKLFPEPKTVTGWRGDELEIDWKYVLNENYKMAAMKRYEGDNSCIFDAMSKVGVSLDD